MPISYEQKMKRRAAAEARAEQRAQRTPEQQLAKLDAEGHRAVKERARLHRQITERDHASS